MTASAEAASSPDSARAAFECEDVEASADIPGERILMCAGVEFEIPAQEMPARCCGGGIVRRGRQCALQGGGTRYFRLWLVKVELV